MAARIGAHELETHLSEYLVRAAEQRQRFLVEREGRPIAALVSLTDLQRLEALDADEPDGGSDRQAGFLRALEELGVQVQWPSGPPVAVDARELLDLPGPPLSEQIIADRR